MARKNFSRLMRCEAGAVFGRSRIRQEDIEAIIGWTGETLSKNFSDRLDLGMADAHAASSGYLFAAANAGNVAAQAFWLKTRTHWRGARGVVTYAGLMPLGSYLGRCRESEETRID